MELIDVPHGAVVVGVDGSHHADRAIDWAARHAAKEARDLVLLHVVDATWVAVSGTSVGVVDPAPLIKQVEDAGQALLDTALARVAPAREEGRVHTLLVRTDPRSALIKASQHASILVLGSRGRGPVASLLLGSVSAAVAAHAVCPTVVVRPYHQGLVRRGVLVGADGTAGSLDVLEFAYRQAAELDLPLTVVHTVWDTLAVATEAHEIGPGDLEWDRAQLVLSETLAGLGEKFPEVTVRRTVIRGTAPAGLLALADAMDLVVVGHQRHNPVSRVVFGSVAMGVLEHAATVVAVVPQV